MTLESILKKLSLLFIIFVNVLCAFAIFGVFTKRNIKIAFFSALVLIPLFLLKNFFFDKIKIHFAKHDLVAIILIVTFCLLTFYFHHDLSRGRDDMVHLASAAKLAETGSLSFHDPQAIMYSGFDKIGENNYTSQFLPVYISYLGGFYFFNGFENIPAANSIALFFGLMAIYFLVKRISSPTTGLLALSWFLTFYSTLWFSKRLNSEIIFLTLFWCVLWYFFDSLVYKKRVWYFISFIPLTLLLKTRGESVLYFAMYFLVTIIILIKTPRKKEDRILKKRNLATLFIPLLNLGLFIIYFIKFNSGYLLSQIENFKVAFNSLTLGLALMGIVVFSLVIYFSFFASARERTRAQKEKVLFYFLTFGFLAFEIFIYLFSKFNETPWRLFRIQFALEIFALYFLFIFILIIARGLYNNSFSKKHLYLFLFCLPSLIFLIEHNIAPDQPWFMRRYFAVLLPLIFILAATGFMKFKIIVEKKVLFFVGILVINLVISFPVIAFIDNDGVNKQIRSFSKSFSNSDLILMEPGFDFQRFSYPMHFMYGLNVAPNLNTYPDEVFLEDLKPLLQEFPDFESNNESLLQIKRLHDEKRLASVKELVASHQTVYILATSPFNYPFYDVLNMKPIFEFNLEYETMSSSTQILEHIESNPENVDLGYIRNNQKNTPPRKTESVKNDLLLLKVIDKNDLKIEEETTAEEIVFYRLYLKRLIREYHLQ